jgi:hypothetical protein
MPPRRRSRRRSSRRTRRSAYYRGGEDGLSCRLAQIQALLQDASAQVLASCEAPAEALASLKRAMEHQQQAIEMLVAARELLALQDGDPA